LNVIILRGLPTDVVQTADLIAKLDVPSDVTVVNYPLSFTNAADVEQILQQLLDVSDRGRGNNTYASGSGNRNTDESNTRLKVSASVSNNQIIAKGGAADHELIAKMLT